MANTSLRKASLQSMEAEIESLLKSLESLKDDASDESRKTLKALKSNAESALKHSRHLLSDAYEEVKAEFPDLFDEEDDRQRRIYLDMVAGMGRGAGVAWPDLTPQAAVAAPSTRPASPRAASGPARRAARRAAAPSAG